MNKKKQPEVFLIRVAFFLGDLLVWGVTAVCVKAKIIQKVLVKIITISCWTLLFYSINDWITENKAV